MEDTEVYGEVTAVGEDRITINVGTLKEGQQPGGGEAPKGDEKPEDAKDAKDDSTDNAEDSKEDADSTDDSRMRQQRIQQMLLMQTIKMRSRMIPWMLWMEKLHLCWI